MMDRRYASPAALERAIADRLRSRYPRSDIPLRRAEVAYRRLVARMYATNADKWVLKGGYGMILRLDPSRTSNDIDVAYIADAGEHAIALRALECAVSHELDDFFSFEILHVGAETEDRARTVTVRCRLGAREFARFRVDLAMPAPDVPAEEVSPPPLAGIPEVDELPPVLALAWPQQIAEKICAIFEQHAGVRSSRARDLADIGMIARQVDRLDGTALITATRTEKARRTPRTLPDGLPKSFVLPTTQEEEWRGTFARATRGAPISFDDALALASKLVDPILDGTANGLTWNSAKLRYH